MKCSVCGKDIPLTYRIKNRKNICCFCYKYLPKEVKDKLKKYNKKQIGKIVENIDQSPKGCWMKYEGFGICFENYNIVLNSTTYKIENLINIKYHFHPEKPISSNRVIGHIIVELDFKNGMKIKESISSLPIGLSFIIKNKKVEFIHSDFFVSMINKIKEFIKNQSYDDMYRFYWEYLRSQARDVDEEKERKAKDETEYKRQQEEQRRREQERARREQQERNSQQFNKASGKMSYEEAKALFGISGSCSSVELKKRRNQLLKKHHPDQGGSPEMCAKVNEAYRILNL